MFRLLLNSTWPLLAAFCVACTPAPRSPSDSAQGGSGISVYGTIDAGVVVNR
ncbi:hypothetical protein N5K27_16185 [Pigmentiphaga sp. GD03639]|uniref:Uncharacterized protein n=1 Tax=Pigmentiphaga daeguensis TaxID=414049 RepID=A0ABN1BGY8_9BURK|nr:MULTISPECIES: hypothetical protein [unclassified Pigmentiphaga]MDH2237840.1 hypothetical protein [Pigmentiphaga sp. GD03639]